MAANRVPVQMDQLRSRRNSMRPRWWKVIRDLWLDRARTAIVVLAMAIGVFGIGIVVNAYAILTREMDVNYRQTNPASAIFYINGLDAGLLAEIEALPQIAAVEPRRMTSARIQTGPDTWRTIWLFTIEDFEQLRVDTFFAQAGQYPPLAGQIALERAALGIAAAKLGQAVTIQIPGQPAQVLDFPGTVHAPGLAPAWMEGFAYGFVSPDTMLQLGGDGSFNELRVIFRDTQDDEVRIRAAAGELEDWLAQRQVVVNRVQIPRPGKHPHADQMASLLFLLEAFGALALLLSGILVTTLISALLSQQIRQIGVMKAIGARRTQISGLYYASVLVLGVMALALGIPIALAGGRGYAGVAAQMLNFNLYSVQVPVWAYLLQIGVGLLVPLLAAAYPVWRGSQITVREALSDYGIPATRQSRRGIASSNSALRRVSGLARPVLLSIRNTFRKTGRLVLTLIALATGGAMFVVAMSISASLDQMVEQEFSAQRFDLMVQLDRPYPAKDVFDAVGSVPGVERAEGRVRTQANRVFPDGTIGDRQFSLVALPADTSFFAPPVIAGRWLTSGDSDVVVINHKLLNDSPDLRVGDRLQLKIGGRTVDWQIVGIIREAVVDAAVYVPLDQYAAEIDQPDMVRSLAIDLSESGPAAETDAARQLERRLAGANLSVQDLLRMTDLRQIIADHLQLIAFFLGLMSILVVMVGGLGLASTMSINVLERRREIGILRSIGASTPAIHRILGAEGLVIGLLSWAIGCGLAYPLGVLVGRVFGNIFFQVPLSFAYAPLAAAVWLVISAIMSIAASTYAARGAVRLPVREVLAYE